MNWRRLFGYPQKETGALLDPVESLENAPQHEFFAGGGTETEWKEFLPPFRYQGASYWCTAYANTDIASAFQKKETGETKLFSPYELFYRTGGQLFGNWLLSAAKGISESVVPEEYKPTPIPNSWGQKVYEEYKAGAKVNDWVLDMGKKYRVKSYAVVKTDKDSLKAALMVSPLSIAIPIGRGYWDKIAPKTGKNVSTHNVVLSGYSDDGWIIKDSLKGYPNFNGYHTLAWDYEILMALSFIDLPNDWKDIQEAAKKEQFGGALEHYGKKRDMTAELKAAQSLKTALQTHFNLKGVLGAEWTVAVNALAYGGYSLTDLLNHYTSMRRGKGRIFNLDKQRP